MYVHLHRLLVRLPLIPSSHLLIARFRSGRCCGWRRRRCWRLTQQQVRAGSRCDWIRRGRDSAANRQVSNFRSNHLACFRPSARRHAHLVLRDRRCLVPAQPDADEQQHERRVALAHAHLGRSRVGLQRRQTGSCLPFDASGHRSVVAVLEACSRCFMLSPQMLTAITLATMLTFTLIDSTQPGVTSPASRTRSVFLTPDALNNLRDERVRRGYFVVRGSCPLSFVAASVTVAGGSFSSIRRPACAACSFLRRALLLLLLLRFSPKFWTLEREQRSHLIVCCLRAWSALTGEPRFVGGVEGGSGRPRHRHCPHGGTSFLPPVFVSLLSPFAFLLHWACHALVLVLELA